MHSTALPRKPWGIWADLGLQLIPMHLFSSPRRRRILIYFLSLTARSIARAEQDRPSLIYIPTPSIFFWPAQHRPFFLNKAVLDIYPTAPSTKSSPGRSSDLRARLY